MRVTASHRPYPCSPLSHRHTGRKEKTGQQNAADHRHKDRLTNTFSDQTFIKPKVAEHQGVGSVACKGQAAIPPPPQGGKIRRASRERVRELPVNISSSSRGARQSGPTRPRLQRQFNPTSAGGVVAANDSRATICSSCAGPGQPKLKSYRRTSGWPASRTGERRLSDCSSRMKERPSRITVRAGHEGRKGDHATPP